jgi:predicted Rossmann fold nucleotide-binding protein DprA/Smf involved in DNA uptake
LACSALALDGDRSLKPLTSTEWHNVSLALRASDLDRPQELLGLSPEEMRSTLGVDAALAQRLSALLSRGGQLAFELERLASRGVWVLTRADEGYPALLKQRLKGQTPPVLFGAGPPTSLMLPAIAVVGSRDVDDAGLAWAHAFGRRCAEEGVAVVSGAARGVDITAMTGALSHGGIAVGVTVDPLERLIRRREMRASISDELLTLVTPFHPSARWHAGNAMRRNRLIYAMSRAAVVVASSVEKGGTRSGALENLQASWVPLHVRDDGTPGNRRLISEGGHPLPAEESVEHLALEQLCVDRRPTLLDGDSDGFPTTRQITSSGGADDRGQQGHASKPEAPGEPTRRSSVPTSEAGHFETRVEDAFVLLWPALSKQLAQPRTEREVADRFKLELAQARAWLKRAVEEGLADVKPRPKRYVLHSEVEEQLRIDAP